MKRHRRRHSFKAFTINKSTQCTACTNISYGSTLSLAFRSNPQDLTRYSTMDNWPTWAAQCKAVYPSSPESKRWPSILGARYSATARWPPTAQASKALCPPCIEQRNRLTTIHHLCTHACRMTKEIYNSRCKVVHVVHVTTIDTYTALCYKYTMRWVTWNITYCQKPYKVTYNGLKHEQTCTVLHYTMTLHKPVLWENM